MNISRTLQRSVYMIRRVTTLLFSIAFLFLFYIHVSAQNSNPTDILEKVGEDVYKLKEMTINTSDKSVTIPCKVNMDEGLIEVVLCTKEGKVHESLLVTDVSPLEFQTALLLLGLDPVNEIPDDPDKVDPNTNFSTIETPGDKVYIHLAYDKDGQLFREPVGNFILDESVKHELGKSTWLFRGPVTHRSGHVIIDPDVSMIATYHDIMALMELNSESKYNDELFYVNPAAGLQKGQSVSLIISSEK